MIKIESHIQTKVGQNHSLAHCPHTFMGNVKEYTRGEMTMAYFGLDKNPLQVEGFSCFNRVICTDGMDDQTHLAIFPFRCTN